MAEALVHSSRPSERHCVELDVLAQDPDQRHRPSEQLRGMVEAHEITAFHNLDRPLVPVLNALVEKGLETHFSCADGSILVRGTSRQAARLLQRLRPKLEGAWLEWAVLDGVQVTALHWRAKDLAANDKALLEGAAEIMQMEGMDTSLAHPAGELVADCHARICDLLEHRRNPMLLLERTAYGWSMHIGYSMTQAAATKIRGSSLEEVAERFKDTFGWGEMGLEEHSAIG